MSTSVPYTLSDSPSTDNPPSANISNCRNATSEPLSTPPDHPQQPVHSKVASLQNMIDRIAAKHRVPSTGNINIVPNIKKSRSVDGLLVSLETPVNDHHLQEDFILQSIAHATADGPSQRPPEPPCQLSIPTFGRLDTDQLTWYLWWRHQWLMGEVYPTSTSYIVLLAYELLNFSLQPDKVLSYRLLRRMLNDYNSDRKLRFHLVRWAADLAWEIGLDNDALDLFHQINPAASLGAQVNQSDTCLPSPELTRHWIAKHPYRSQWRDQHKNDLCHLLQEALSDSRSYFTSPNTTLESKLGLCLPIGSWHPYREALVLRTVYYRCFQLLNPNVCAPLFTMFVRRLENLLRTVHGVKHLLKTKPLPQPIEDFIQARALTWPSLHEGEQVSTEDLVINSRQVDALLSSAEALRQSTSSWLDDAGIECANAAPAPDMQVPIAAVSLAWTSTDAFCSATTTPAVCQADKTTAIGGIECYAAVSNTLPDPPPNLEALLSMFSTTECSFLKELDCQSGWSLSEAKTWSRQAGSLLTPIVDAINNRWIELYDATLITIDASVLRVNADFIPEFARLVDYLKGDHK